MSIKKEYLIDKGIYRVKFSLPPDPDNSVFFVNLIFFNVSPLGENGVLSG